MTLVRAILVKEFSGQQVVIIEKQVGRKEHVVEEMRLLPEDAERLVRDLLSITLTLRGIAKPSPGFKARTLHHLKRLLS